MFKSVFIFKKRKREGGRSMQQFALVGVLLVFAGIGYCLMGKLDAFIGENERHQEGNREEPE